MNKCILKGNVGQDPKITSFSDGGKIAFVNLATSERGYTTKDGREIPEETTWHNVVVKKAGLVKIVESYVKKGSMLLIEGSLHNRKYTDRNGIEKTITEVWVEEIELLNKKPSDQQAEDDLPWER